MLFIPVIDIRNGQVVHANQNPRNCYQTIKSVLGNDLSLHDMVEAYLRLYPFTTFYIADLDAIDGHENNLDAISLLANTFNTCNFWLDAGIRLLRQGADAFSINNIRPVIGTEKDMAKADLISLFNQYPDAVLSLDFEHDRLPHNTYLMESDSLWPDHVIVMMMHRIGSHLGADQTLINTIQSMTQRCQLYAAGGIRDKAELLALQQLGIHGVLIASAIHNGNIISSDLTELSHR